MNQDPESLAAEISADLAPSDFPADLGTLPDDDLVALHVRVEGDASSLRLKVKDMPDLKQGADHKELYRLRAILKIKRSKCTKVEDEFLRRAKIVPSDDELRSLTYPQVRHVRTGVNDALIAVRERLRQLERLPIDQRRRPASLAELARSRALIQLRKNEFDRISAEIGRRKGEKPDPYRFRVDIASIGAPQLEAYLNHTRDMHPGWWPENIISAGDHVLVVWRIRESEDNADGDAGEEVSG